MRQQFVSKSLHFTAKQRNVQFMKF
jgi:hypothetical protein